MDAVRTTSHDTKQSLQLNHLTSYKYQLQPDDATYQVSVC